MEGSGLPDTVLLPQDGVGGEKSDWIEDSGDLSLKTGQHRSGVNGTNFGTKKLLVSEVHKNGGNILLLCLQTF